MACYHPLKGYRGQGGTWVAPLSKSPSKVSMTIACRQCIGCRLDLAKEWGVRISHEAQLHENSSFVTLTYSDEHLPKDGSLSLREMQLFLKRLRKKISPQRVRFYLAGEYGGILQRPHYHLIIFGYRFPDLRPWRRSESRHMLYRSAVLEDLWPYGHAEVGAVTRASGAYVARYCLKKLTGPPSEENYGGRTPEFASMSTKPGIGAGWFQRYETDAFPSAFIVLDNKKYPVPRYYKNKLRRRHASFIGPVRPYEEPLAFDDSDRQRAHQGNAHRFTEMALYNSTEERLAVREEVQDLKQKRHTRSLGES